jgi:hypothetical protein
MPDSTEIKGDQKNTTVFGFSAPWVVALTAVILIGIVGVIIAVGNIYTAISGIQANYRRLAL